MRTLLRIPELVEAVQPLIQSPIDGRRIFELINVGRIEPLGYLRRMPIFDLSQLADVASALSSEITNDKK